MALRDLKYLLAYLLPLSAACSLVYPNVFAWATVLLAFVCIPILEQLLPTDASNLPASEEESRRNIRFFDWLLYLNAPITWGLLMAYFHLLSRGASGLSVWDLAGITLGIGIVLGANGINVAHELGHRANLWEQRLAQGMLTPSLYMHFFIEHNRGHHKHVATSEDPASARFNEPLYAFWLRSVSGGWRSAWRLEAQRLAQEGLPVWTPQNTMLRYVCIQALWLLGVYAVWGVPALIGALLVAKISALLLETINYVEHYGLQRKRMDNGRYEPVSPRHSWNSDHEVGRIMLYELTRHSDHHYKSNRKYQILRHMEESPQLPFGYPLAILMALIPPLWFAVMNPRASRHAWS